MSKPAAMFISLAYSAISSGFGSARLTLRLISGTSCALHLCMSLKSLTATRVPSRSMTAGLTVKVRLYPRTPSSSWMPQLASRTAVSSVTLTGPPLPPSPDRLSWPPS